MSLRLARHTLFSEEPNAFSKRAWLLFPKSLTLFSEEPGSYSQRA